MPPTLSRAALALMASFSVAAMQREATPPQGGSIIAGTLTSADAGRPVRRATVKLVAAQPASTKTATTDANGRFVFANLPAGDYTLSASKAGFLESVYGARRPGPGVAGTPIRLAADERRDDIAMRLPRGAVISGVVTDEFGDAAMGVVVRAIRLGYANGERVAQPVTNATTDDLGGYRLAGLPPGEYVVSAVPRDTVAAQAALEESVRRRMAETAALGRAAGGRLPERAVQDRRGYVPIYFPGTPSASAAGRVAVGVSQQVPGIDIQLQEIETLTIAGTVSKPDGSPAASRLQLIDPGMPVANLGVRFGEAASTGKFSFAGVSPGSYVLNAQAPAGRGAVDGSLTVSLRMAVDADAVDVALPLRRGVTVSGAVDLASLRGAGDVRKVRIRLAPIATASDWELAAQEDTPDAAGDFVFRGVAPGRYRVLATGLPSGWWLDSAVFGDRDAADVHLQVEADSVDGGVLKFTPHSAGVGGTVVTADGNPASDRTVILFPEERAHWVPQSRRIHVVQPGQDGRYAIRGLPPGEYRVAAVDGIEAGQQYAPDFLALLAGHAQRLTLSAGAQTSADIRVR